MTVSVTNTIDKLLTVEDVMAALRISRPTLYRLLKSGRLVPVRIGKRTLFDPADIRSFIEASKNTLPWAKGTSQRGREKKGQGSRRRKSKPETVEEAPKPASQDSSQKPRKTRQPKVETPDDSGGQGRLL